MLYMTARGVAMWLAAIVTMMAVAAWVTRGDRKYTEEGQHEMVGTLATGMLISLAIFLIDVMMNIAW